VKYDLIHPGKNATRERRQVAEERCVGMFVLPTYMRDNKVTELNP
jgi:hypothetical protein